MHDEGPASGSSMIRTPVRSYQDLIVWQRSMELVDAVYDVVVTLPRDERFELASQLRRASVSIAANIAEGHGRQRSGAFARHVSIARGSTLELDTLLLIARRRRLAEPSSVERCLALADEVSRMLASLIRRLEVARVQARRSQ